MESMQEGTADDATRLWRFRAEVLSAVDPAIQYAFGNPVPIHGYGRVIGAGNLEFDGGRLLATCFVNYGCPERLDVEAGRSVWLLPRVKVTPVTLTSANRMTIIEVESLQFTYDCDGDQQPVGGALL